MKYLILFCFCVSCSCFGQTTIRVNLQNNSGIGQTFNLAPGWAAVIQNGFANDPNRPGYCGNGSVQATGVFGSASGTMPLGASFANVLISSLETPANWCEPNGGPQGVGSDSPVGVTVQGYALMFDGSTLSVAGVYAGCETNVTLNVSNPSGSGVIQYVQFVNNGSVVKSVQLCPGQSSSCSELENCAPGANWSFVSTSSTIPAVSNVVATVTNPSNDQTVNGFWQLDGSTVFQQPILPGQSASQDLAVSLCGGDTANWGYSGNGLSTNSDNPLGTSTNNTGSFSGNVSGGNGTNNGNGYGGLYSNTYFTNNINWPVTGTNLALDSSLRAGFGTLHNDDMQILNGLTSINGSLQSVASTIGNLGNLSGVGTGGTGTNSDGYWFDGIWVRLDSVNSNLQSTLNFDQTNRQDVSVNFTNTNPFPTNGALEVTQEGVSNVLSGMSTNLAQQVTLQGISNLVAGIATNFVSTNQVLSVPSFGTNLAGAQAVVASSLSGPLGTLAGNLSSMTGPNYVEGQDSPGDLTYQFQGVGGSVLGTIDFNPLHNAAVNQIAGMIKRWFAWLLVVAYLAKVIHDTIHAIETLSKAQSNHVPVLDVSFFGTGGNYAGAAVAGVCAGIALVVWAGVLGFTCVWTVSGLDVFGTFNSNPLAGAPSGAVGMAEGFFPFGVFFALVSSYLIWRVSSSIFLLTALAILRIIFG